MSVAMTASTMANVNSNARAREFVVAIRLSPAAAPNRIASPNIRSYANEVEESPARPITAKIAARPSSTRDAPSTEVICDALEAFHEGERRDDEYVGPAVNTCPELKADAIALRPLRSVVDTCLAPGFVVRGDLRAGGISIRHRLCAIGRWTTRPDLTVANRSKAREYRLAESGTRRSGDRRRDAEWMTACLKAKVE